MPSNCSIWPVKKIILDENVPRPLRQALGHHIISTVQELGWKGIENGELLTLLENRFDVFITADKNLRYQQNLSDRKIAIIELPFNSRRQVMPLAPKILEALEAIQPNDYLCI